MIVQTMRVGQFREEFKQMGRNDSFTYEGLGVLFEYLESLSEDIGEPIEMDVIALCGEYSEMEFDEFVEYHDLKDDVETANYGEEYGNLDDDDKRECIEEYLANEGALVGFTDKTVLFQNM